MEEIFDVIVIGTGTAASTIARRCRRAGRSVAIVDERPYGGTCVLRGCDPKKLLRRGAEVIDAADHAAGNGVVPGSLRIDWPALVAYKRSFTEPVPAQREKAYADLGIATLHGTARFTGATTLAVGGRQIRGERIAIAVGAQPRPLGLPGEDLVATSTDFLELEELPRRVLFVGGGFVSFEFAHMAARAGAQVTVLSRGGRPLGAFDPDLVDRLVDRSRAAGIGVIDNAEASAVERMPTGMRVRAQVAGEERQFEADLVVHGAGRVPALGALDLDLAGVRATKKGVEVDACLQSVSNPAVYAAGDAAATPGPPLTPVASLEGEAAAANILEGGQVRPDYTGIPSVVFTIPALARVGLLESEAKDEGADVECKLTDMSTWYSVQRVGETHAAAKTLVERGTGRILGVHLLGPESSETINLFALAMRSGLRIRHLKDFISAYPSAASDIGYMV